MNKKELKRFHKEGSEHWYEIENAGSMEDFFLSLQSSGDVWAFMFSQGGITAGRVSSEYAIFPYYTADKISDMKYTTGSRAAIKTEKGIWKPLDMKGEATWSIATNRNLTKIRYTDYNKAFGLTYALTWTSSEKHGLIKEVNIKADKDISFTLLEGAINILPSGISTQFQSDNSILLDAYKKTDLERTTGTAFFTVNSIVTDKAEPNESLTANISYFTAEGKLSVSESAYKDFCQNHDIETAETIRGRRGAFFIEKEVVLKAGESFTLLQVFDTALDSARAADFLLEMRKKTKEELQKEILKDIEKGREKLENILKAADGCQETGNEMDDWHHEANVLFNVMRGGTFLSKDINIKDFLSFAEKRNHKIAENLTEKLSDLNTLSYQELGDKLEDTSELRLFYEYIPLSFSRRHGDPSRPWNHFLIKVQDNAGKPILNYEGNWRDIFQNWESLSLSYPDYLANMVSRFFNSMSIDGYNPYRINRDGIEWECPDPDNPWSQIGYWNDHQVVYLDRLIRLLHEYGNTSILGNLNQKCFTTANIPYRIKSFAEIEQDPHNSIRFDYDLHSRIMEEAGRIGSDGKLIIEDGKPILQSFTEKVLQILVSKLCNLVPEGGIWMNTQRPEWNDANNALAGFGLSIVSLSAVRSFVLLLSKLYKTADSGTFTIPDALHIAYEEMILAYETAPEVYVDENRKALVQKLGSIFEKERNSLYKEAFGKKETTISREYLLESFNILLKEIDRTLEANRRKDGLFHSYNVLAISENGYGIERMKTQLEGQVAILSSGFISPEEAVTMLQTLRNCELYESYTGAYTLYPDKNIPQFWEKNQVTSGNEKLKDIKGRNIFIKDGTGVLHFRSDIRNPRILSELTKDEEVQSIYENTFHHHTFSGRSDAFFAYEGLGSVYWHMVSKLLVAISELIYQTNDKTLQRALFKQYADIRSSLGYKRSAESYGAFPFMPYSHTPKAQGAKQPGMTGQVKEEIITRFAELGVVFNKGQLGFQPRMLERTSFKDDKTLQFSRFATKITYHLTNEEQIKISINGNTPQERTFLSEEETNHMKNRDGIIKSIDVMIPEKETIV